MWQVGRSANENAPYYKLKVFISKFFKVDCYLLKYPKGSKIKWHTDPSPNGYKHYRLNITLQKAKVGGKFVYLDTNGTCVLLNRRFNLFRPDIIEHGVSTITDGTRYVLSIGWLVKE